MKKVITVGLMYHSFCCGNLGVGALAISECEILKNVALTLGVEIKVLCFEAGINDLYSKATNIDVELIKTSYYPSVIKQFRRCDIIIDATAGDSFSDIYGMKIFTAIFIFKWLSILSGVPVILAPQTIGPFKHAISKTVANLYLRFVAHIFLRDELSSKEITNNCYSKLTVASDMAFVLPYRRNLEEQKAIPDIRNIGFNISGLLYNDGYNLNNSSKNFSYKQMCDEIIERLLEKGYRVYLVPHVVGHDCGVDNDYYISEEICKRNPKLVLAPYFNNPVEAKSFISGLDFFIGSRMHATIAAISSGIATVPIAYSRKFQGVFEPLGYDVCLDATRMSTKEIIEKVLFYDSNSDELKEKSQQATLLAQQRLANYQAYLSLLIKNKVKM